VWGGVFWHPAFASAAGKILELSGKSTGIVYDQNLIGLSNLLFRNRSGLNSASIPLLFQYYGPLFFDARDIRILWEQFDEYLLRSFDFAYLSLPPNSLPLAAISSDWRVVKGHTLAVGSADLQGWGNSFKDDVRNKISKARREKVRISVIDYLPEDLWAVSFARKKLSTPITPAALAEWCRSLTGHSLLRIFAASIDGLDVAFRGELIYGDFAYDWIAGSEPSFHSTGANQLLMAEIGLELSKKPLLTWDLVGGDIKAIADFKKSFGALEIEHLRLYRSFNLKGSIFKYLRSLKHGN